MNRSIFLRLVWKEYRLQRALWIAMVLLTAMILFLFHVFALNATERFYWQLSAGLALPALYCLGCGATLFAGEREAGTFEFQRSLPVGAKTVFAAKFLFALASAAAMFALSGAALTVLNPGSEINPSKILPEGLQRYAVAVGRRMPLLGLELLLWSVLFSLLLRRVLVAAVLGVFVGSVNFEFARGWYSHFWSGDVWIAPELVMTTVAVALADLWLGARWFREKRQRGGRAVHSIAGNGPAAWSDRFLRPSRLTMVGRLVWQHWRQTWRLVAVLVGVTLLPLVAIGIEWLAMSKLPTELSWDMPNGISYAYRYDPFVFFFAIVPAFVGVSLLGMIAFHADQWGRGFRFLADRGATPKYVWLSRQLVCWATAAAALPAFFVAALFLAPTQWDFDVPPVWLYMQTCGLIFGYVILSVAAGQFCSMFFRSGILAGLFGIILTLVLAGWTALMWIWQINWLWSVLPIPLALLLATRLRARDWLVERNTLRSWLRPGLALAAPALALLTAVPLYRVYQIPWIDPGFSPDEFAHEMTPEERTAFDRYERTATAPNTYISYNPAGLSLDKAAKYQQNGKLDEALEEYITAISIAGHCRDWYALEPDGRWGSYSANDIEELVYDKLYDWAVLPGQTPERLLAARKQLEHITANISPNKGIKLRHLQMQRFFEGEPGAIDKVLEPMDKHQRQLTLLWLRLPSERARALRILNLQTASLLGVSAQLDRKSAAGERLWMHYTIGPRDFRRYAWRNAIYPLDKLLIDSSTTYFEIICQRAEVEAERRAMQIILALEAWKLQHGSLPKTLDELVGPCLDRLPNDPYTGKPFLYFPDGMPASYKYYPPGISNMPFAEMAVGKPFIWSAGERVLPIEYSTTETEKSILNRYEIKDVFNNGTWRKPATETELWSAGRPFPIP